MIHVLYKKTERENNTCNVTGKWFYTYINKIYVFRHIRPLYFTFMLIHDKIDIFHSSNVGVKLLYISSLYLFNSEEKKKKTKLKRQEKSENLNT